MSYMRRLFSRLLQSLLLGLIASPSFAEEKSFYSPVIRVDTESHRILIPPLVRVLDRRSRCSKPHPEKLPISGLVDFVVEMRENGKAPLLKTWKLNQGRQAARTSMEKFRSPHYS